MSRILAICFTAALAACHSSAQVTTTSARVPHQPPPSGTAVTPPPSPSPDPGSSQMPFEPRNFGR